MEVSPVLSHPLSYMPSSNQHGRRNNHHLQFTIPPILPPPCGFEEPIRFRVHLRLVFPNLISTPRKHSVSFDRRKRLGSNFSHHFLGLVPLIRSMVPKPLGLPRGQSPDLRTQDRIRNDRTGGPRGTFEYSVFPTRVVHTRPKSTTTLFRASPSTRYNPPHGRNRHVLWCPF